MSSKKNLEIAIDENSSTPIKSPRLEYNTPNKRSKFQIKLSPVAQSSIFPKAQLNIEGSLTEPVLSHRLVSPRLPPIKSTLSGSKRLGPNVQKFRTVGVAKTEGDEKDEEDYKEYMEKLMRTTNKDEIAVIDEKPKDTVGHKAVSDYYYHIKKLDKVKDQNIFRDVKESIYTSFLAKSDELNMFPSKIGLIKERGSTNSLEIK